MVAQMEGEPHGQEDIWETVQKTRDGRLRVAALLVAAPESLVHTAALGCEQLPPIEGVECEGVDAGVVRAVVKGGSDTAAVLGQLRQRLDLFSVASALDWQDSSADHGGALGAQAGGAQHVIEVHAEQPRHHEQPAPHAEQQDTHTAAPENTGLNNANQPPSGAANESDVIGDAVAAAAPVADAPVVDARAAEEHAVDVSATEEVDEAPQQVAPPAHPLARRVLRAMDEAETWLASGWVDHKVICKGAVEMWRKPVEGFPMRAVKFKGLVDTHGRREGHGGGLSNF